MIPMMNRHVAVEMWLPMLLIFSFVFVSSVVVEMMMLVVAVVVDFVRSSQPLVVNQLHNQSATSSSHKTATKTVYATFSFCSFSYCFSNEKHNVGDDK
jgi:hypothetical protein